MNNKHYYKSIKQNTSDWYDDDLIIPNEIFELRVSFWSSEDLAAYIHNEEKKSIGPV